MYTYCTPSILKETLTKGYKISNLFYEINPLREPNKRINHYRNTFQNESQSSLNRVKTSFQNSESKKKKEQKKLFKSILCNSPYSDLVLRINYERPNEIKNEDGVIISRHFKPLDINFREYPKTKTKRYYYGDKISSANRYRFNERFLKDRNYTGNNFFRTEIKVPNKNINKINIPDFGINTINSNINNPNNNFTKTIYVSRNNNMNLNNIKFLNIENSISVNNITSKKLNQDIHT